MVRDAPMQPVELIGREALIHRAEIDVLRRLVILNDVLVFGGSTRVRTRRTGEGPSRNDHSLSGTNGVFVQFGRREIPEYLPRLDDSVPLQPERTRGVTVVVHGHRQHLT